LYFQKSAPLGRSAPVRVPSPIGWEENMISSFSN